MTKRSPVVVIYRGGHGALAIARTLGRLAVPVYLVAQEGMRTPVWFSRYWTAKRRWDFSAPEERSVEFLLELGRDLERRHRRMPLLMTLADWAAIFIEDHADRLGERFVFTKSAGSVVRRLANKWEMFRLAKLHGIPTPETAYPRSLEELKSYLETVKFPVIVKSADPFLPHVPVKAVLHDAGELIEKFEREAALGPPNMVVQEYIPGDAESVWMCNAYFDSKSQCRAIFSGKKLRQVSATGIASLAVVLTNEIVESQTKSLLQSLGYWGCVGVGYRYDARDGQYKLLDVNARISGVFRLFRATNGLDVVRACYFDLTGQPVPSSQAAVGRKWLLEEDILGALSAIRHGEMSVAQWVRSLRGVRETQWFSFDDPLPLGAWIGITALPMVRASRWMPSLPKVLARRPAG
jgi:D-aspartate ligase